MARSTMSENESHFFSIMVGPPSFFWSHEMGKRLPQTLSRSMQQRPHRIRIDFQSLGDLAVFQFRQITQAKCLGLLPGQFHQRLEQSLQ